MSLSQMTFDRVWTNPVDFPTHETLESKVREDMQYLFDSIKNQFNNLISNEFTAENVSFAPTPSILTTNIQDTIEFIYEQMQGITQGAVPDGSITTAKLADEAVTAAKVAALAIATAALQNSAVTEGKIADGAVATDKIGSGAVTTAKLANTSVTTDKIANNAVTSGKLANDAVITARIASKAVTTAKLDDGAVTSDKIGSGAVGTAKIADAAVTEGKLGASAVATAKIADSAVTTAKINNGAVTTDKLGANAVTIDKTSGVQAKHKTAIVMLAANLSSWTVPCDGVTSSNTVIVSCAPAYFETWRNYGIHVTSQSTDTLTFASDSAIPDAVTANIAIFDL